MRSDALPQSPLDLDIFRDSPVPIDCIGGLLRKPAVSEYQASGTVYGEASVDAEHLVVFRFCEWTAAVKRIKEMELVHRGVIRLYYRPFKYLEFFDCPNVLPIERFLQSSAVINEHYNDGAAIEPCPLLSCSELRLKIQFIHSVIDIFGNIFIAEIYIKSMLHSFFGRAVNNLREQAVSFVKPYEFHVIRDCLLVVLVRCSAVLCGSVFVQQVAISVLPELILGALDDSGSHLPVQHGFLLFVHFLRCLLS